MFQSLIDAETLFDDRKSKIWKMWKKIKGEFESHLNH